jgi:DNA repair protein RadA/Sms
LKKTSQYECTNCGAKYSRWQGECNACHQWNTIVEDISKETTTTKVKKQHVQTSKLSDIVHAAEPVTKLNMPGLENVLGGGIHESQISLIAGEPGIGKSTLLLQILQNYPKRSCYISGEESLSQIAKRAERITNYQLLITNNEGKITKDELRKTNIETRRGEVSSSETKGEDKKRHLDSRLRENDTEKENMLTRSHVNTTTLPNTEFVSSTDLNTVLSVIESKEFQLVIIDSIQTVVDPDSAGFAGSANQVRLCTFKITEIAKKNNIAVLIVGQITKEGEIAGPKMMEHLVDTVLYFEGDRKSDLRILKSYKNRFGSVGETAIFEMKEDGLHEILDPSGYFIDDRSDISEGVAYSIVADGSMIYAVEIQALVNKTFFPIPKRLSTNFDNNRMQMLVAVLQKKLGLNLFESDIYVNVSGGVKVTDTAADLAVCAAIISSFKNKKLDNSVYVGEVGLTGNIQRTVRHDAKLKQAGKLGFKNIFSAENLKNIQNLSK